MNCITCSTDFKPFVHNQMRCRACVSLQMHKDGNHKKEARRTFYKECEWCGNEFQLTGPASKYCCKVCRLEKKRASVYGISRTQLKDLLGKKECDICGSNGFVMDASRYDSGLVVDHCHDTGKVRGMLCHNCNRAIGLLQDSTDLLKTAVNYLERATTIPKGSTAK